MKSVQFSEREKERRLGGGGGLRWVGRTVNVFGPYLVEGDVNEPAGDKKKALKFTVVSERLSWEEGLLYEWLNYFFFYLHND